MHYTTLGASGLNVSRQSLQQFLTDSPWTPAAGWRSGCGFVVDVLSRRLADGLVEGGGAARDRVVMGVSVGWLDSQNCTGAGPCAGTSRSV
jgi:hypothetical protein